MITRAPSIVTTIILPIATTISGFGWLLVVPLLHPSSRGVRPSWAGAEPSPLIRERRLPVLPAEYCFAGRGEEIEKAQMSPVRTGETHRRAHIQKPWSGWRRSSAPGWFRSHPTAQQPSNLRNHHAHMPVLPIVDPAPGMRQPQIESQFVETGVGGPQVLLAGCPSLAERVKERLLKVERRVHQSLGHGLAVGFRETFRFRQQPRQHIEGARQDNHVVGHYGLFSLFASDQLVESTVGLSPGRQEQARQAIRRRIRASTRRPAPAITT